MKHNKLQSELNNILKDEVNGVTDNEVPEELKGYVYVPSVNPADFEEVLKAISSYDSRIGNALDTLYASLNESEVKPKTNFKTEEIVALKRYALGLLLNLKWEDLTEKEDKGDYDCQLDSDIRTITDYLDDNFLHPFDN